ncbi:hypothetical protein BsWGS_10636 [Bradybaena similaris]
MAYDIQVIIQASLYFLIFVLNFIVAIPLGVNVSELNNQCMLYTDWTWQDSTLVWIHYSRASTCNFPVYLAVVCIFYSLLLGIYNMYVVYTSKDPNIGSQMWVLPFIVLTALVSILVLVASCMLSVGIKYTCDGFMKIRGHRPDIQSCSYIETITMKDSSINNDHLYCYPKISEIACWITFLAWTTQESLFVFRFFRNRRSISDRTTPVSQ